MIGLKIVSVFGSYRQKKKKKMIQRIRPTIFPPIFSLNENDSHLLSCSVVLYIYCRKYSKFRTCELLCCVFLWLQLKYKFISSIKWIYFSYSVISYSACIFASSNLYIHRLEDFCSCYRKFKNTAMQIRYAKVEYLL